MSGKRDGKEGILVLGVEQRIGGAMTVGAAVAHDVDAGYVREDVLTTDLEELSK